MITDAQERRRQARIERLTGFWREFENEYRSAASQITCTLAMRHGGHVLPSDPERAKALLAVIGGGRRFLGSSPIPQGPQGSRGEFLLFGDEGTAEVEFQRAIRPVIALVPLAIEHLRDGNVELGSPRYTVAGWLWICFALAWKFGGCRLGYTVQPDFYPDNAPGFLPIPIVLEDWSGPEDFNAHDFRWGKWASPCDEGDGADATGLAVYRLDSDIRKSSALAIDEIIKINDMRTDGRELRAEAPIASTLKRLRRDIRDLIVAPLARPMPTPAELPIAPPDPATPNATAPTVESAERCGPDGEPPANEAISIPEEATSEPSGSQVSGNVKASGLRAVGQEDGNEDLIAPSPNAERDKSCYEWILEGKLSKEILESVKQHGGWQKLGCEQSVIDAADAHAKRNGLRKARRYRRHVANQTKSDSKSPDGV